MWCSISASVTAVFGTKLFFPAKKRTGEAKRAKKKRSSSSSNSSSAMASIQDSGLFPSRKRRTGDIVDSLKREESKRPFTAGGKNR